MVAHCSPTSDPGSQAPPSSMPSRTDIGDTHLQTKPEPAKVRRTIHRLSLRVVRGGCDAGEVVGVVELTMPPCCRWPSCGSARRPTSCPASPSPSTPTTPAPARRPGEWIGGGAGRLGLDGEVAADDLRAVLAGIGARQRAGCHRTGRRSGRPQAGARGSTPRSRCPKSASVLYAVSDDPMGARGGDRRRQPRRAGGDRLAGARGDRGAPRHAQHGVGRSTPGRTGRRRRGPGRRWGRRG